MTTLKRCPCGEVPESVSAEESNNSKYAYAMPSCCNEWMIEFRTNYKPLDSAECIALAESAWNDAPRGTITTSHCQWQ
jgi:hypothetical protein